MIFHKTFLYVLTLTTFSLNLLSENLPLDRFLSDLSKLPIEKESAVNSVEFHANNLIEDLGITANLLKRNNIENPTHFFAELCLNAEKADAIRCFQLSDKLENFLFQKTYTSNKYSYKDLKPYKHKIDRTLNQHPYAGTQITPNTYFELLELSKKIKAYESVRLIFQIKSSNQSLESTLTRLILFLPQGMVAYQNQLEEQPFDAIDSAAFQIQQSALKEQHQTYKIILSAIGKFESLESTLIKYADGRLFPQTPILFAQLFDDYRDENYIRSGKILRIILKKDQYLAIKKQSPKNLWDVMVLPQIILRALVLFFLLLAIFLSITAFHGSIKANHFSIYALTAAWGLHLLETISLHGTLLPDLQTTTLMNASILFIAYIYLFRKTETTASFIAFTTFVIIMQWWKPSNDEFQMIWATVPLSFKIPLLIHSTCTSLIIALTSIMLASTAIAYWLNRDEKDQTILQRTLVSKIHTFVHLINAFTILGIFTFFIIEQQHELQNIFESKTLVISISILAVNALFLQQRWTNELKIHSILQICLILLLLSLTLPSTLPQILTPYLQPKFFTNYPEPLFITSLSISLLIMLYSCGNEIVTKQRQKKQQQPKKKNTVKQKRKR